MVCVRATARRDHFQYLSVLVIRPCIDRVRLRGFACRIVRQHHVDRAGDRVRFHVFRPVHRRRSKEVCRIACLDQHIRLAVEAVGGCQRAGTPD